MHVTCLKLRSKAFKPFATAAQDAISSFEAGEIHWSTSTNPSGWQATLLAQEKSLAEAGDPDGSRWLWTHVKYVMPALTLPSRFVCSEQAVKTEWTEQTNAQACLSCAQWCSVYLQYFFGLVHFPCLGYLGHWPHHNPLQGIRPISSTDLSAVYYC